MANQLTKEYIEGILKNTEVAIQDAVFGKVTIASAKLPNGFVITVDSACVDPANYDPKIGAELCIAKITDKIWELEGYLLQEKLSKGTSEETESSLIGV